MALEGGCFCGAIRYRVDGEAGVSGLCHCETCRRVASAPCLPFTTVRTADFAIEAGAPVTFRSSPRVVRGFCGACGSPLTYLNEDDPEVMDVMTCSLDNADALRPTVSVWIGAKLDWDEPNPNCRAFSRSRAEGPAG